MNTSGGELEHLPEGRLARMWRSALFWSVAALYVFPWLITQVSLWHESFAPASAERLWSAWWYHDDPLSQFVWGSIMLACGAGTWYWLERRGVRRHVARPGDLNAVVFGLVVFVVALNWYSFGPVEFIALELTGQTELPFEKPGFETSFEAPSLPGELFSSVIAAPLFEEFAFRGFLLGVLLSRGWPAGWSIVIVAAVFAGTHEQYYLSGQVSVFLLGAMLGALRIASGGLAAPILAHALSNLLITVYNFGLV
ncbi:MAG: CPBP family intramembrane metalloprotease [Alphaproteobacteria bacterium]|nr:CPBP family intramembrane metalloprotease [Alphaproteobacteria bacterium]